MDKLHCLARSATQIYTRYSSFLVPHAKLRELIRKHVSPPTCHFKGVTAPLALIGRQPVHSTVGISISAPMYILSW